MFCLFQIVYPLSKLRWVQQNLLRNGEKTFGLRWSSIEAEGVQPKKLQQTVAKKVLASLIYQKRVGMIVLYLQTISKFEVEEEYRSQSSLRGKTDTSLSRWYFDQYKGKKEKDCHLITFRQQNTTIIQNMDLNG